MSFANTDTSSHSRILLTNEHKQFSRSGRLSAPIQNVLFESQSEKLSSIRSCNSSFILFQPIFRLRGGGPTKRCYYFGNGQAEGDASMKNVLGGKGANCAEMAKVGLSVPPGFTITCQVTIGFYLYYFLSSVART